jgi:hypothetical protein
MFFFNVFFQDVGRVTHECEKKKGQMRENIFLKKTLQHIKNNTHNKSSSPETRLALVPVIERVVTLTLLALLVQKYKS